MACGRLGAEQEALPIGWTKVEGAGRLDDTMMVVQAEGDSMKGLVEDGQYCVMRKGPVSLEDGKVVLVMESDGTGHFTGGSFVLKRFYRDGDKVVLKSVNPDFHDIELSDEAEYSARYRAVAEFKCTL